MALRRVLASAAAHISPLLSISLEAALLLPLSLIRRSEISLRSDPGRNLQPSLCRGGLLSFIIVAHTETRLIVPDDRNNHTLCLCGLALVTSEHFYKHSC